MGKVTTPHEVLSTAWLMGCAGLCLFLSGCFAQRAELTELEQVYGGKLISLDKQNKKVLSKMRKVEEQIDQQEQELSDKIKGINQLVRESHARLNQKLANFREQDLRSIQDGIERTAYRLDSIRTRLDDMGHKTKLWLGVIEKVQSGHGDLIKKGRDQFQQELQADRERFQEELRTVSETITAMAQSLDTRLEEQATSISEGEALNRALMIDQMKKFEETLSRFKTGLETLGEHLVQGEQRINNLAAEFTERTKPLATKLEADARSARSHLEEVNRRFDTVAKALESVTEAFTERVESQEHYLGELSKAVQGTNEQLTTIRREMASSASLRDVEHSLKALVSEQDRYLDELGKAVEAINTQVGTLHETMAPAVAVSAVEERVVSRVDEQDRYVDELAKIVEAITSQVVTLNDQMASSVQTINDRLASLTREIEGLREAQNGARANGPGMPSKESVPEQGTKLAPAAGVATRDAADGSAAQSDKSLYEQHMQKLKQGDL
ncbi:hypothetical protein MYX04_04550 [Nitrospiraceae bacterium AH_259_D15_M11_P09]|nr:hypothetical protein [Nitrospiraceae bacterium AH_259_D15_M11_P09]